MGRATSVLSSVLRSGDADIDRAIVLLERLRRT
jgi:hypothetical protein